MKSSRKILGDRLYDVYTTSHGCMCIYNLREDKIIDMNPSMMSHTANDYRGEIKIILAHEGEIYLTLDDIPCKLTTMSILQDGVSLMMIFPAHTKKWSQSSDLVTLTDVTSDGIWEWFPEIDFEYMSERFWSILGYDQKEMDENPRQWMEMLNPDDKVSVMGMCMDHIKSKGDVPYMARARYTRKDGQEVIVLCRGMVVDWMPNGKPWRLLGTHTDVTDIVKKDAVDAKTKFISRMSHEIRSPICTILNECELLGEQGKTRVIRDTCKQLISITDDILSIGKAKGDCLKLIPTRESLEDIISRCTKRHRLEGRKKGIKIRSTIDDLPGSVMMDTGKFNQVLDNLIGNSLKYSDSGIITLDTDYDEETGMCSVRVSDEGVGMDPSFHTNAFDELVQGDDTTLGAGIGLTLCRRLAEMMNGNVTIEESSIGKGTTMLFVSHLPVVLEDEVEDGDGEGSVDDSCTFNVLIVDDIKTNREILKRRLESVGTLGLNITKVLEAVDGVDAIDKFRQYNGDFQLVLMDCHMPILNGFDSTVQIHNICSSLGMEAVPVVAVTASVSTDIYDKCMSVGMKYVVTKPYSEMDLMASIQSCMVTPKI